MNLMGTFAFLKGNTAEALDYFNKAIEADPKYVQSYIKRSSIYMERGKKNLISVMRILLHILIMHNF